MPTKIDTLLKKCSFRQKSNQFFAFVYVFPIRQDNFFDNYLNIYINTGMMLKYAFCLPQQNNYDIHCLLFICSVYLSIQEIVFAIIISLTAGLLLIRSSQNQGLLVVALTSSPGKFYGLFNDLINHYGMSMSQMNSGIFRASLSKSCPSFFGHDLSPNITYHLIFNIRNATPFKHSSVADRVQ